MFELIVLLGIFTQGNLSQVLDQLQNAWSIALSYRYIFFFGSYQLLANTRKNFTFS